MDNSFSQWYKVNSGVSSTLNSIFFKDNLNGWMCGFETVIRTTDGGITWSGAFLPGNHRSINFTDSTTGWICGDNGRLYKSINAGLDWSLVNAGVTSTLHQINFINQNTGFLIGTRGTILKTTNAGLNWFSVLNLYINENFSL